MFKYNYEFYKEIIILFILSLIVEIFALITEDMNIIIDGQQQPHGMRFYRWLDKIGF